MLKITCVLNLLGFAAVVVVGVVVVVVDVTAVVIGVVMVVVGVVVVGVGVGESFAEPEINQPDYPCRYQIIAPMDSNSSVASLSASA